MNNDYQIDDKDLMKVNRMNTNDHLDESGEVNKNEINLYSDLRKHESGSLEAPDDLLHKLKYDEKYELYQYITHFYVLPFFLSLLIHCTSFIHDYSDNYYYFETFTLIFFFVGLSLSVIYSFVCLMFFIKSKRNKNWLISFLFNLASFFAFFGILIVEPTHISTLLLMSCSVVLSSAVVPICFYYKQQLDRDQIIVNLASVAFVVPALLYFLRMIYEYYVKHFLDTYYWSYLEGIQLHGFDDPWYPTSSIEFSISTSLLIIYSSFYNLFIGFKHFNTIRSINKADKSIKNSLITAFLAKLALTLVNAVLYFLINRMGSKIASLVFQLLFLVVYYVFKVMRDTKVMKEFGSFMHRVNKLSVRYLQEKKVFVNYIQERATLVKNDDVIKPFSGQSCMRCPETRTALYFSCGHNFNCESCGIKRLRHYNDCEICEEPIQYVAVLIEDKSTSQLATKKIIIKRDK